MLRRVTSRLAVIVHDDDGATMMEYALIAALALVIVLFTILAFTTRR